MSGNVGEGPVLVGEVLVRLDHHRSVKFSSYGKTFGGGFEETNAGKFLAAICYQRRIWNNAHRLIAIIYQAIGRSSDSASHIEYGFQVVRNERFNLLVKILLGGTDI